VSRIIRQLLLPLLLLCQSVHATTVTLVASADSTLYQAHPDSNLGGTSLIAGTNNQPSVGRALIRFNLSSIPANAILTDAVVTIAAVKQANGDFHNPISSDFGLYPVLVDWSEGGGTGVTGSLASPGEVTWNDRHFESVPWVSPGGQFGIDFGDLPLAVTTVNGLGTFTWGSTIDLVALVQSWINAPSTNNGVALICQDENTVGTAKRFASKEDNIGIPNPGPQLTLTYVVPTSNLESWRYSYFNTLSNTGNAANTADADHDGLVNLIEFACHLDPTSPSTMPGTASINGSTIEFTYTRSKAAMADGFTFAVEWSDLLSGVSWSGTGVTESVVSQDSQVQNIKATLAAGGSGHRFVRLKVTGN
jgi:hypothetical protein